ncbi:MAG: methylenetetrahydrofolate reductase C-terminal domain-containing protein, partial [Sedimenticola sp.]
DVLLSVYNLLEPVIIRLDPLWKRIGYHRVEGAMKWIERVGKGFLFDCKMCGKCVLSSTGMSCPMNCPKTLRNGPCGGVRLDGRCEVKPQQRCVWVEAWRGSQIIPGESRIAEFREPVRFSWQGSSSWMRMVRQHNKVAEINEGKG